MNSRNESEESPHPSFRWDPRDNKEIERRMRSRSMSTTSVFIIAAAVAVVLGMMLSESCFAQDRRPDNASVTIEAPAYVAVGETITLRLRLESNVEVYGMEAQLLYARSAAEFAGFDVLTGSTTTGRLVIPELKAGSVVGFYTCETTTCANVATAQAHAAVERNSVVTVELLPLVAGQLEVKLGHVLAVDPAGQPIVVTVPQTSVVVQIGEATELHAAPTDEWDWNTMDNAFVEAADIDVTADRQVTRSDLMEVALAWQIVREAEAPCGGSEPAADINGDGCVDIADVQITAAHAEDNNNTPAAPTEVPGGTAMQAAALMTFTVDSTLDEVDANIGNGICRTASDVCTLRAAIAEANANPGQDTIVFHIPGSGVQTIQLKGRLPTLHDETGGTLIDGYSQPGATPNTDSLISNAQIRIEIRGGGFSAFDGLTITSAGNVVQGLAFYDLKRSIWIYGVGAFENVIVGNFIGTNAAGTFAASTISAGQAHGIHVEVGARGNRIGGVSAMERNVISGNARHGVGFWHLGTDENVVFNNLVGLSPDGSRRIRNWQQGIDVNYGASFNIIGGTQPGERNVLSGNGENGAEISHGDETTENEIRGNFIGTDVTGTRADAITSNGGVGVSLEDRVTSNLVKDNVIGNNRSGGLHITSYSGCCTTFNRIEDNRIGISLDGSNIGNGVFGIQILAVKSQIGPGNIIAYNPVGVQIEDDGSTGNTITQNSIFGNLGLGIDIAPIGQINLNDDNDVDSGPNARLNFPVIETVSPEEVNGTACADCRVEIFVADVNILQYGEGKTFVGAGMADNNGVFTIPLENVEFGDYLTATATDLNGNTSEFSRNTLVPNPDNAAPVAVDDNAVTLAGTPVTIDVLANDVDPDGDELSIVDVSEVANGDVSTDGSLVVYTPTLDFQGAASFTYMATDDIGGASAATVTVTVEISAIAGVKIDPTEIALTENGPSATYTVALESEPTDAVTITVLADSQIVVSPTQLVFDSDNWTIPQMISVTAVAGDLKASAYQSIVRHRVNSEDSRYNNMGAPNLVINVTEGFRLVLPIIRR